MDVYQESALAIQKAALITVLTGAGISTASGIPDFRSNNGLYQQSRQVEELLSEHEFKTNPERFWAFYKEIFKIKLSLSYQPNFGHFFFKQLENDEKQVTVLTQNVDGLHRKAGSKHVYELHGTIEKSYCPKCLQTYYIPDIVSQDVPVCSSDYTILKPDVVLFGGSVRHMDVAYEKTTEADLFITAGTSLKVYPAKEIPGYIQNARNITKLIINNEPTSSDHLFDIILRGDINTALQKIDMAYRKK